MSQWVLQSRVTIVTRHPAIDQWRALDGDQLRLRVLDPEEIATAHRLIDAIDTHGVVRGCSFEIVAPDSLRVVSVCTRIDQYLLAADAQRERQRVGMTVR